MCGICGIIGRRGGEAIVRRMIRLIAHRGPDGSGIEVFGDTVLGHTRLSIIDLATGSQPMKNDEGTVAVTYNGEIYNFREIREDLEKRGHRFRTSSDTEVLIHGYEEFGTDLFGKLNGIFAFALWDNRSHTLYLARDCFGVKPLYYYAGEGRMLFASEMKALLVDPEMQRRIDHQSLHLFLNFRYIPGEGTLLSGVRKLPPGHFMSYSAGSYDICNYFTPRYAEPVRARVGKNQREQYVEGIVHYLSQAVKRQLIADVPVGVYLSGGLDSSSITAIAAGASTGTIQTFSMGFNEPTDELDDARRVAGHFGTDHYQTITTLHPMEHFPAVIWHAEEPKENILQGYLLARFAARHVKVVLGGLGGDELFDGYSLHKYFYPVRNLHRLIPQSMSDLLFTPASWALFRAQGLTDRLVTDEYRRGCQLLMSLGSPLRYYNILRNVWDHDDEMVRTIYSPHLAESVRYKVCNAHSRFFSKRGNPFHQMIVAEMATKLIDDFLMNEDRTSMAHGLEVRVPFLDRDLVDFVMQIPHELKMRNNETKALFRQAMSGILPKETITKKKWGFSFNPYLQFSKDLKDTAEKILTRERVMSRGWFNYEYLRKIIDHSPHPRLRWHYFFLWIVLGLEIWAQMFLDGDIEHSEMSLEAYY